MKWFRVKNHGGDKVIKRWFALWPITVRDETRWLEWVSVEYQAIFYVGKDLIQHGERAVRFLP